MSPGVLYKSSTNCAGGLLFGIKSSLIQGSCEGCHIGDQIQTMEHTTVAPVFSS
jgi:hypothetical protein